MKKRLSLIRTRQLYKLFQTISRHLKRREKPNNSVDPVLLDISTFYLNPEIFKHIVSKYHSEECTKYHQKGNNINKMLFLIFLDV